MTKYKITGFTLIELVSVIVILGIIAAVAVPRFINLQREARISSLNGMMGAVNSAMNLAHAQALAEGQSGATGSITMEGTAIGLVYGYPKAGTSAAVGGRIDSAVQFSSDNFTYFAGAAGDTGAFQLTGAPTPSQCTVNYTQATATTAASTSITTTGC